MIIYLRVELHRTSGPPQGERAATKALEAHVKKLAFDLDARDDGKTSKYKVLGVEEWKP